MTTEELINGAELSINVAQNLNWVDVKTGYIRPEIQLADAQSRALLAIAQELKRLNDNIQENAWTGEV